MRVKNQDFWETGKIRSIGVSNYEIWHLNEIKEYSKIVPAINQVQYHPHLQRQDLKLYCHKNGIFFQVLNIIVFTIFSL